MINTYNQADPTRIKSPSSIMKITLWIFTLSVFAQIVGICIFGVYFHQKVDKIVGEMDLNEDYLFIRTIQKCVKGGNKDSSMLNCKKVIERFHGLFSEIAETQPYEAKQEKLTDGKVLPSPKPHVGERDATVKKDVVAIHLVGDKLNSTKDVLHWKDRGYLTTKSEISYANGKFRVEIPGVYYVYTQVSFSPASRQQVKAPFVQYIYMKRPHETERLLLKGANSFSSQTTESDLHSSRIGALFTFKKNDFIFVNVTDPSRIDYSPEFTYFGMFKLSDRS